MKEIVDLTYLSYIDKSFTELIVGIKKDIFSIIEKEIDFELLKEGIDIKNFNEVKKYIESVGKKINGALLDILRKKSDEKSDMEKTIDEVMFKKITGCVRTQQNDLKQQYHEQIKISGVKILNSIHIEVYQKTIRFLEILEEIRGSGSDNFVSLFQGENPKQGAIQKKSLYNSILHSINSDSPLGLISTVCPSYSHDNGKYDFNDINTDVGLLSEYHGEFYQQLIGKLQEMNVEVNVTLLIADVAEGYDQMILDKYADGDILKYLKINQQTAESTQKYFDAIGIGKDIDVKTMSSFYDVPLEKYIAERKALNNIIERKIKEDKKFANQIKTYKKQRTTMIGNFLDAMGQDNTPENQDHRVKFALSQYFDHFNRLRQSSPNSIIVNHSTSSLNLINQKIGDDKVGHEFPIIVLDCNTY